MRDPNGAPRAADLALSRHLNRIRSRTLWFRLSRGLGCAAAAALSTLLLGAVFSGARISPWGAALVWLSAVAAFAVVAAFCVGRLNNLQGPARARLIARAHPDLSQRLHSAAELSLEPNGSPELLDATVRQVLSELNAMPAATLVRAPAGWARTTTLALAVAGLSAAAMLLREDVSAGLFALTHPSEADPRSASLGLWVSRIDVNVTFPEGRSPERALLLDPTKISVPEGSSLRLAVTPRISVERATLRLQDRTLPFTRGESGKLVLELTATEGGPLALMAERGGAWIEDKTARKLAVERDQAPVIELRAPLSDQQAAADQPIPFAYTARDDHGLEGVDLVVQLSPDQERHLRLASLPERDAVTEHTGQTELVPEALGVSVGQTFAVWIEARDRDPFGGPNVGRSPVRTITVGDPDPFDDGMAKLLAHVRDLGLDQLADRLERTDYAPSQALQKGLRGFVKQLDTLTKRYDERSAKDATSGLLRDMSKRLSRLSREERRADRTAPAGRLARTARAIVTELEDDVLWLTDLLGREKLEGAARLIDRLNATKARMEKQLKELRETGDPQRKQELMAEIVRARSELLELARKLQDARSDVPSDFVNYDALSAMASADPLSELEDALGKGDLDAAERALSALSEQIGGLEGGMSEGSQAYAGARFAPRNEAAERARSELGELSRAQDQLAGQTDRIAQKLRDRSGDSASSRQAIEKLSSRAKELADRAVGIDSRDRSPLDTETQDRGAQRLRDTSDALKQGNVREALDMADRALDDLRQLAMESSMDARMFEGPHGASAERAKQAEALGRDAQDLRSDIAQQSRGGAPSLEPGESEALRGQAPGQRALGETAKRLAKNMQEGPGQGMSKGLDDAVKAMERAADALEQGKLEKAQAQQQAAKDQLDALGEQLERQAKATSGQGQGGEGHRLDQSQRVGIPKGEGDTRHQELRRRVLDARRAEAPEGYSDALKRYYEEILR